MIIPYYTLVNHVKVNGHVYKSGTIVVKMINVDGTDEVVVQRVGDLEQFITKSSNLKEFNL